MDRRKFLEKLSISLTAASAVTLQSCGSTTGKYLRAAGSVNVKQVLKRVDAINEQIRTDEFFDVPSRQIAKYGCNDYLFRETLESLLLIGVMGDLSKEDQMHPLMQERMRESAGLFDRVTLGMATFLENMSKEQRAGVSKKLVENPDIIKSFQAAFDKEARKNGVPYQRLRHFHTLWNRASTSLKKRNNSTIIDEYIEKVDKVALQNGITPEIRRALAKNWDEELVVALAEKSKGYEGADALLGSISLQQGGDSTKESKREWRIRTGQKILGVSGMVFGTGLFFLIIGLGTENFGFLVPSWILGTVGAILLIIGLIFVSVGAATPEETTTSNENRKKDPIYQEKVTQAVEWANKEKQTSEKSLERIALEAVEKFGVEFNDVWEKIE